MKTVLITGTSKGIGLETALAFGRAGYKVFATMRNPSKASDFKQKIINESLDITISEMDVDSDVSVKKCIDSIIDKHGKVDVLVNNAGIERHGSIEELSMEDFKSIMETNYFGVLRCTKKILPIMRKNQNGCIINVASVSGHISNSPLGAYAASKFALEAVSEALAQEVKPFDIRVAIVEPGIINTQMAQDIKSAKTINSIYPQVSRFGGLFAASLKTPTQPTLVADKILEISESNTWKLRHPVGPDSEPFIQWRASMSDEQWIDWNAASNEDWYKSVEQDFGLNAR
ncbi:short-chain dehydrogenase/reductase [Yeosuana aromativorans]|uniref:Short-chain dehydrogenase/reductase n=1 Tax=Yeosuana aromativorans TaxID=288019 RepID=A0A8J3BNU8_9FLAO|nr:SDR family oxidoreductase [Yeosuana aromativorans]GGK24540.1 short-chain dehydrogenase/reductase [Yeosuana aromativorans]